MKKLTIIGGGSVRTPFFAYSLAKRASELNISELCLFDRDPARLEHIGALSSFVAGQKNPRLKISMETNVERAIADTAYFVVSIREGGDHSRVVDEEIAQKFGVLGQETTGAGGLFMAARSIPPLINYYEKIRRLTPQAWIFNFTNPSGMVTQAMRTLGYERVIGICDTPSSTRKRIADAMSYDDKDFYLEFYGLNHLSWAHKALYRGKDVLEEILNNHAIIQKVGELAMFDPALLKLLGVIPNEYLYYYYYQDKVIENIKRSSTSRGQVIEENNKALFADLADPSLHNNKEEMLRIYLRHMFVRESSYMKIETAKQISTESETLDIGGHEGYAGIAMNCIEALEGKETQAVLSVPNENSIHGFANDDVVEITCNVDNRGPHPVYVGTVNNETFSIMKAVKTYERLGIEAITKGRKEYAIRALMAHPLIGSFNTAKGLIDEFILKQGSYAGHWT